VDITSKPTPEGAPLLATPKLTSLPEVQQQVRSSNTPPRHSSATLQALHSRGRARLVEQVSLACSLLWGVLMQVCMCGRHRQRLALKPHAAAGAHTLLLQWQGCTP
jgi:hypothetical protein